eukprot:scaffold41455_cov42-Phaeocystis_antarctica.AAC.1
MAWAHTRGTQDAPRFGAEAARPLVQARSSLGGGPATHAATCRRRGGGSSREWQGTGPAEWHTCHLILPCYHCVEVACVGEGRLWRTGEAAQATRPAALAELRAVAALRADAVFAPLVVAADALVAGMVAWRQHQRQPLRLRQRLRLRRSHGQRRWGGSNPWARNGWNRGGVRQPGAGRKRWEGRAGPGAGRDGRKGWA